MARGSGDESKEKRKPGCGPLGAAGIGAGGQKMLVGFVWSCADMKLLLFTLVVLFALFSLAPLLPPLAGLLPASSDLRACISRATSSAFPSVASAAGNLSSEHSSSSAGSPPLTPENYHYVKEEVMEAVATGPNEASAAVVKRSFNPVGSAAYLFIQMGAYRGGPNTFAVVGLASKPLHVFGKPTFQCEWIPHGNSSPSAVAAGRKILPDWGYGRVYTVVVVNCTFEEDVGADGSGGRLVLSASAGGGFDTAVDAMERIEALVEAPGSVDVLSPPWASPPKYDYLYCGSPMYGDLNPQRVREWLAYHAMLFGDTGRTHFVLHDAGGAHPGVMEVLQPWMQKGLVTLQDVREQERFDGYYHNQFLVVNDCLHRHRFAARWIFFFDVDEFLYVEPRTTLRSLLAELSGYAQFTFEQMPMSANICLAADASKTHSMWGMEKLVYRDVKRGVRRDRKYAIQPRSALAAGVHLSQHAVGGVLHRAERRIRYFHYHGTVADRRDPCRDFANATQISRGGTPYVLDGTLRALAASIKRFELRTIGPRLRRTRQ
ncbi:hypothetical protein Taro_044978 [Colocasia esculenta]|uniref:Glycosyltransferase family 92 protein n=1 Tax=Colocasia esculenta TaxID=4460 RepID=A0A843WKQ3_COLES|nr:hypothetical protein [Colocasia esculenta]